MAKRADQPSYQQQEAIVGGLRGFANVADPALMDYRIGSQGMPVSVTTSSTQPATYYTASQLMQNR